MKIILFLGLLFLAIQAEEEWEKSQKMYDCILNYVYTNYPSCQDNWNYVCYIQEISSLEVECNEYQQLYLPEDDHYTRCQISMYDKFLDKNPDCAKKYSEECEKEIWQIDNYCWEETQPMTIHSPQLEDPYEQCWDEQMEKFEQEMPNCLDNFTDECDKKFQEAYKQCNQFNQNIIIDGNSKKQHRNFTDMDGNYTDMYENYTQMHSKKKHGYFIDGNFTDMDGNFTDLYENLTDINWNYTDMNWNNTVMHRARSQKGQKKHYQKK